MRLIPPLLLLASCTTAPVEADPDAARCTSACRAGALRCGATGEVQTCADGDGDGCNEWGGDSPCPVGGYCSGGGCVEPCEDACAVGDLSCAGGVPQACVDDDDDGCLDLAPDLPCLPDERCDAGECVPLGADCEDVCPGEGQRACTGEMGYRTCGDFDVDACLDWSVSVGCDADTTCRGGECVPDCTDACVAGERRCEGNAFVTCGQHDADACLDLSLPITCREDERCDNGRCVPAARPCEDECAADGVLECDGEGAFRRCGQYDADACFERSGPVPCAAFERCEDGVCVAVCEDACNAADRRCGGGGVEACGNFDADACLEWGPARACRDLERCDEGRCVPDEAACEDTCVVGARICDDGVRVCGEHDEDPCVEWSAPAPCAEGSRCEAGRCVVDCEDGCAGNERTCVGAGVAECGDEDGDGCLAFGAARPCADGESCSQGVCRAECVDECDGGAAGCVAEGVRRCGDFDADPCRDWSSPTPCGAREACADGACVAVCDDECAADASRCLGEGFELCGDFDADDCLEFGGGVGCDVSERCEAGACVEQARPVGLRINEVLYDVDGHDPPAVFVELYGPPSTSLAGFRLVAINGATGGTYADLGLVGQTDDSGLWLLAHPDAGDALRGLADQLDPAADLQNGPDSVRLVWGEEVVDALAYGVGARHEAGEGAPAPATQPGESLTRDAAHTDTDDNASDFAAAVPSPSD